MAGGRAAVTAAALTVAGLLWWAGVPWYLAILTVLLSFVYRSNPTN